MYAKFAAQFLDDEQAEADVPKYEAIWGQQMLERLAENRRKRAALIVDGKLYVTVITGSGKQTWSGSVVEGGK